MKNENMFKLFARYVSLNVLGMIALSCYILADTFFVSKALGAAGLAALNLAIPVYNFIHGSGLMIGMGGGTKYSIFKSQGKREAADQIFTNAAAAMVCIAAVFFFTGLLRPGLLYVFLEQMRRPMIWPECIFRSLCCLRRCLC